VDVFCNDAHALTDLLSEIIGTAPICCPHCARPTGSVAGAGSENWFVERVS
jgi:hypothetical protein